MSPDAVARGVVRALLAGHRVAGDGASSSRGALDVPGSTIRLRLDHVCLGEEVAALALRYFSGLELGRVRVDSAIACAERGGPPRNFESASRRRFVQEAAIAHGLAYARPGTGTTAAVYLARFAAPGRTVVSGTSRPLAAGAFGALPFVADEIELAAALAGVPLERTLAPLVALRLIGSLSPGIGAHDLACTLALRFGEGLAGGAFIECRGPALPTFAMSDRLALARSAPELGACAVVFPSDAVTREALRVLGRESDWKALEGEEASDADRTFEIHLEVLEPMVAPAGQWGRALPVRDLAETRIGRVVIGPEATLEDLARLASIVRGRAVAAGLECMVIPGSRELARAAGENGLLRELRAAGVRLVDAGVAQPWAIVGGGGAIIAFGAARADDAPADLARAFEASVAVCAASALAGHVADPRALPAPSARPLEFWAPDESGLVRPAAGPSENGAGRLEVAPLPSLRALEAGLRGVVLATLGDRVESEAVLPWSPRVSPLAQDPNAMSEFVLSNRDPLFAARARAERGGFLVAGEMLGAGPARPYPALALVALGVRTILARSYAPGFWRALVHHGVLPLRFLVDADRTAIHQGDELEIPGLPEGLESNKPIVVRNLTQGAQYTLLHDLSPSEIELVRAGGLMAMAAHAAAAAPAAVA